ncbi:MAG: acyl-CoA dehydrogenase family protein [Deltaproteobacteria bacterium]|nr:acyl-CoA dehydrogenase family protein [Deltaproteobacteria bacterium]MBW2116615.1 acyl-CoA dehydrogenase family protein [Deltaproteobacteria bacterium]MBW2342803.1 acyl-CoA dehydrogenase family protein [Deltaproteobacteria bacterium]
MDFELSKEQTDIRKAAKEFAEGEFRDIARDCDLNEEYPETLIKKGGELGFIGVFIDEAYGGAGLGFLEHALIMEEFWKVDPGLGQQFCSVTFGSEVFLLFGSENQKKKYLPPLARGKAIMGFAITEPDAGSDTASASTSAVLKGAEYVINGSKVMIGNGSVADFMLVFCLTDPEEKSRSNRHSIMVVETDRPGYDSDKLHGKMGLRASDTANIYFSDLKVPRENLVGGRTKGFYQLMQFFDRSRAYVAAHGVGLAQGALDLAIQHVRTREQFGQKIASFQATQFKIADMATKVELARTLTQKACSMLDQGRGNSNTTAMAKLFSGRMAVEVVDEALQLHGGYGYFNDQDVERFYRAAKVLEIYEGAKEIEKMIIGRNVLGRF